MRVPLLSACLAIAVLAVPACSRSAREQSSQAAASGSISGHLTVPTLDTLGRDPANWPMAAGNYASTRFSELGDITSGNASRLKVAWTFSTGMVAGHEAAPLVIGSTMFVVTPYPNVVYALDLGQAGAPVKWRYEPAAVGAAKGVACCDVVNRGVAYWNGSVIFNTLDSRTIALDAETGAPRWEARLGDISRGETMTMAPLVVKDKVFVGNSGGEFGVRGWITALDAATGAQVWRAYSTGPDQDVLIGPLFKPFYEQDRGTDLGVSTWPPGGWKTGGGTVWGWLSYDADSNLLYYGTANPGPWNPNQRPGDNKWTSGIFARDADTGEARWFYQWNPHDLFDHDGVNENVLLDLQLNGSTRKVLVHPERNGYIYVLDRTSGEVLSASPFVHITSSTGVDLKTGRLMPVKEKEPRHGVVIHDICPSSPGAKDWNPSSFSPRTGLLYVPHNNLCMDAEAVEVSYIAGTPFVGTNVVFKPGPGGHQGLLTAWDPVAAKPAWQITEKYPVWSGTLATSGGVVFYGTLDGWFKAVDAKSGQELWRFKTGSGIVGQPVTYRAPDGRQYVAIFSGIGGWPGSIVVNDLDTRDATAGNGWGAALHSLKRDSARGGMLYVFAVDGGS